MVKKMSPLPCSPFFPKFQNFDIFVWFSAFLLIPLKKMQFKHLIYLICRIQNDIYIVSKLF